MSETHLAPGIAVSPAIAGAFGGACASLLREMWPSSAQALIAPDLVLDFAAQYIRNTLAQHARWSADELAAEYLRQMTAERWATVRRVAAAPRRGSPATLRLFLSLVDAAARHRERPPLGTARQVALVIGAYGRAAFRLGRASVYPVTVPLRHRDLARFATAPDSDETAHAEREVLARALEAGGLLHGPNLAHAWRLMLVAVAIARRGAAAIARARGEQRLILATREQALGLVEGELLRGGQLWAMLSRHGLVRDITERFLARRAALPTLLGL